VDLSLQQALILTIPVAVDIPPSCRSFNRPAAPGKCCGANWLGNSAGWRALCFMRGDFPNWSAGERMNAGRFAVGFAGRLLLLSWTAALASAGALEAQVGLTSGLAQVVLVVRSAPRATIQSIGAPTEHPSSGSIREVSVRLRISANTAYRLMVIRSDTRGSASAQEAPVWVRAESGEFQALEPRSAVLIARGNHDAGERDLEVLYRLQTTDSAPAATLPVRYEIAIDPKF